MIGVKVLVCSQTPAEVVPFIFLAGSKDFLKLGIYFTRVEINISNLFISFIADDLLDDLLPLCTN